MVVNRQPIEALQMRSCPHDPCAGLACPAPYTAAADDALCTCECKRMRPLPPALLHQSWSTSSVAQMSPQIAACVRSWAAVNPSMRHQIYDDAMHDEFIRKHYPQWAPLYFESLVRAVERSDVFRYLVVHKYGGFWADIDALAKRPITSLRGDLIVGREPQANADGFGVLQYFFGATPRHPFFTEHLLPLVAERARRRRDDRSLNSVLWVTGPQAFTAAYKAYVRARRLEGGVDLDVSTPTTFKWDADVLPTCALGAWCFDCEKEGATRPYVEHRFLGSWRDPSSLGAWNGSSCPRAKRRTSASVPDG